MRVFTYLFVIIIILIGISFATLNSGTVNVNYYVGHRILPLSLLMAAVFALGALIGITVGLWLLFKIKLKNYRLRQRLKMAEKEIENLRAIPLQDKH